MSTLPTGRWPSSGRWPSGGGRRSTMGWLLPLGMLFLAGGIAILAGSGNRELVEWLQENSTCNERPCTYDEAKGILIGIGVIGALAGAGLIAVPLWRRLRTRDSGPSLPPSPSAPVPSPRSDRWPASGQAPEPEPTPAGGDPPAPTGFDNRFGFPDQPSGNTPADRLAALDAQLAAGQLDLRDYQRERERILSRL